LLLFRADGTSVLRLPVPENGPRILLIDDHADSRALARLVLTHELPHVQVEEIVDAISFAQAFGRADFDLVVLDPGLPWTEGLAVLHALKERWPLLPVLLFTEPGGEEVAVRAAKLGADDLLVKSPGGYLKLPLAVLGALEQARSRQAPPPPRNGAEEGAGRRAGEGTAGGAEFQKLAAIAAHEMQEPLRMVERYTRILAEDYAGRLDGEADELLGRAHEGAVRLQGLIDDLLVFSRLDAAGRPLQRVESEDLLQQALSQLQPTIEESGAVITHGPLPVLEADPGQIVQLLRNLLSNAIKFQGNSSPRVHLSAMRRRGEWVFALQDNGIGLALEDAERIFGLFTRLHPELPGSGIGLAICRRIVERHGGRIWAESQPGRGSIFFFTLPETGQPLDASREV
jgi:signal transduction histidine kinase